MACYSNEQVDEARRQLAKITADGDLMTLIIADEMDEMDRSVLKQKEEERLKKAEEEGMQKGMQKGMEKGMQKGMEKGKVEANKETAKKMLERNIEIELIMELTGLSKEEIEKLN